MQSFCSELKLKIPGSSNVAYCRARRRLAIKDVDAVRQCVLERVLAGVRQEQLWLGHQVKVVDGTGIKLADTSENQAEWPQPSGQRPGCGFPVMQIVGCFCMASGAIIDWVETALKCHECRIFRRMLHLFDQSDVVLGDRGFCSYANLALLVERGAHAVMRAHQMRQLDYRQGKGLGSDDRIVTWIRPTAPGMGWSRDDWNALPKQLRLRIVRIKVEIQGFRVHQYDLVTTQLIEALPEAALEGKTLSGDALYSNKNLVREIVQERGGEVLVQLKANQKTTLEEATRRLNQSAPPFYTQPQNLATDA